MILKTLIFLAGTTGLFAGNIDGNWAIKPAESTKQGGKVKAKAATLELHSQGSQLEGKLTGGKKKAAVVITDGKVDGNTFSFITKTTTKKGERTLYWKGSVEGDQLKGTHSANQSGGKHGQEFTAKKLS